MVKKNLVTAMPKLPPLKAKKPRKKLGPLLMKHIQVSVSVALDEELRQEAAHRKISVAAVVRERLNGKPQPSEIEIAEKDLRRASERYLSARDANINQNLYDYANDILGCL